MNKKPKYPIVRDNYNRAYELRARFIQEVLYEHNKSWHPKARATRVDIRKLLKQIPLTEVTVEWSICDRLNIGHYTGHYWPGKHIQLSVGCRSFRGADARRIVKWARGGK